MKPTLLLMAGAAAITLAACDRNGPTFGPPKMRAVSTLNCPERSGDLRRVSAAADGKTCAYTDDDGGEVVLQLVAVSGAAEATLKPIEASLAALVPALDAKPAVVEADAAAVKDAGEAAKDAAATGAAAASDAGVDAAAARAEDGSDAGIADVDEEENVEVDMPGLHVRTKGDKADVKVFGMTIHHDDVNDTTQVRREPKSGVGRSLSVDANDSGAVIRMANSNRSNIKATVIYGMENPGPQGHRVVGYVARGPRTGPLVVATVKSKRDKDQHVGVNEGIFADASRLARRASRG